MLKIINPFQRIPYADPPLGDQNPRGEYFNNVKEINVGDGGSNVMRADRTGLWLGGKKFADATFSVDMDGSAKFATRAYIEKDDGTRVAYMGKDPDAGNIWGFIAERGYGLMLRNSANNYSRIFVDEADANHPTVFDMSDSDRIKFQDNLGFAIARLYGRTAGFTNFGGLDLYGVLGLFTATTAGAPTGVSDGQVYYDTTLKKMRLRANGAWETVTSV